MMTALPKEYRLRKRSEFSRVYKGSPRTFRTKHFLFLYKSSQAGKVGLVVRKKIYKLAVHRNYIRRILKMLYAKSHVLFSHVDLIVIPTKPMLLSCDVIQNEWQQLCSQIKGE